MKKKSAVLICLLLLGCTLPYLFEHTVLSSKAEPLDKTILPLHHPSGRTVLVIYSYHNSLPWQAKIRTSLYENLEKIPFEQRTELYEEYFDALRFDRLENHAAFLAFLQKKYQDVKLDLVITESDLAYRVLKKHSEFFSQVPRLHVISDTLEKADNSENLLKALPNTKQAVLTVTKALPKLRRLVIIGNSNLLSDAKLNPVKAQDIYEIKPLIPQFLKLGVQLEILPLLSFAELSQKVAQLTTPDTALLYFPVEIDRLGERKIPKQVLRELYQLAQVPIFVHHDSLLDAGSVGGYLLSADKIGKLIADAVSGLPLPKNSVEIEKLTTGYYFNDAELKRWHISDENLPPDSLILNRKIPDWYKYRWEIFEAVIAILLELALIIALLHSLRLRRKAAAALTQERDLLEQRVKERTFELEANKEFVSCILDSLSAHITVLDENSIITAVNHSWREFADCNGLPKQCNYAIGSSYFQQCEKSFNETHLEEVMQVQHGIMAVLDGTRAEFYFEYPCHSPNEQRWFFMRVLPLQGSKKGVVVSHENITERKQTELQNLALIQRNQVLMDNAIEGVHILDDKGNVLQANKAFCRLLGYSEEEALKLHVTDWDAEFTENEIQTRIKQLLTGQAVFETLHRRKDGSVIHVEVSTVDVTLDGQPCIYASSKDITERKQIEETLKASEERFKTLFYRAPMGIALIDSLNGQIYYANSKYAEIVGLTVDELQGIDWMKITHPDDIQADLDNMALMNAGKTNGFVMEKRYIHTNGSIVWVNLTVAKLTIQENGHPCHHCIVEDITERKQSEQALQQSEARYERAVNGTNDGIWEWNVVTGEDYLSPQWKKLLGYQDDELPNVQGSFFDNIHPDDYPSVLEAKRLHFQEYKPYNLELRLRCKNGEYRWFHSRGQTIWDEQGQPLIQSGSITDITERKQIEVKLRESEEAFRRLFEDSSDPVLLIKENKFIDCNSATLNLLGYSSKSEFINCRPSDISPKYQPDGQLSEEKAAVMIAAAIEKGYHRFEWLHIRSDGSSVPVEVSLTSMTIRGEPIINVCWRDITERKHIENQLRESKNFFELLAKVNPIGIYQTDAQGKCVFVNDKWCEIADMTIEQAQGDGWSNALMPDDRAKVYQEWISSVQEQRMFNLEYRFQRANGNVIWVYGLSTPIYDELKMISGYVGTITDISERKRTEAALARLSRQNELILKSAGEGIYGLDTHGHTTFANPAAARLLGYTLTEMIGHSQHDLIHHSKLDGSPYPRESCPIYSAIKDGKVHHVDTDVFWRRDGTSIAVDYTSTPILDESGEITGAVVVFSDITERKQAEWKLQESERKFRQLIEQSPIPLCFVNNNQELAYFNPRFVNTFGYSTEEIPTLNEWWQLIYPDPEYRDWVLKTWNTAVENALATGSDIEPIEYKLTCKDGTIRIMLISGIIFSEGLLATFVDMTERKQAEIELRIAATVFEAQEGMIVTDANQAIIRANKAFTEITGYSLDEVMGKNPSMLSSGRQNEAFYTALWQSITDTGTWKGEIWNQRKSGEIYPEYITITAVKDLDGNTSNYVAIFNDISSRKAAEEEIKQLAFFDPLTGLPNRRKLLDRLQYAIALNRRTNSQFAVFMMDLDKFKAVNDKLGHAAGDELLKQVAARITACLRESDMVVRLGGDEFVLVLENLKIPEATETIALKVIADLTVPFQLFEHNTVQIGVSIGISLYPQHGNTPEILMDNADTALYQAKDNGRGCFAYFSEDKYS